MKDYKYILLDWDGNLARTLDLWMSALKVSLERRGYSFTDEEVGANFTVFRQRMTERGINDIDVIIDEADGIATLEYPALELYPDALFTLMSLHYAGKKIALVTTSRHDQVDPLLKKYELYNLFDVVICGDDVKEHKPHPEPIEKALDILGAKKAQSVMVGDSASDISGAKNAGIDSILFFPPEHTKFYDIKKLKELQPTHIIEDFREIISITS